MIEHGWHRSYRFTLIIFPFLSSNFQVLNRTLIKLIPMLLDNLHWSFFLFFKSLGWILSKLSTNGATINSTAWRAVIELNQQTKAPRVRSQLVILFYAMNVVKCHCFYLSCTFCVIWNAWISPLIGVLGVLFRRKQKPTR